MSSDNSVSLIGCLITHLVDGRRMLYSAVVLCEREGDVVIMKHIQNAFMKLPRKNEMPKLVTLPAYHAYLKPAERQVRQRCE